VETIPGVATSYDSTMRIRPITAVVALSVVFGLALSSALGMSFRAPSSPRVSSSAAAQTNAQFYAAANSVLQTMSKILDLPEKSSLKESIRSKAQIRAFLANGQKKDESAKQRYADQRTLEAFGLIPKGFPLDPFLLNLLTDQVAGLYDPRGKQFFIADWISPEEQEPVMAHELTHALDDQYFHLQKWQNAVRSNDDASLARDAVVEGSAVAAMLDYSLADLHTNVRSMPDIAPFIETSVGAQMETDPNLAKAPLFIRDELLFPYLQGAEFTQQVLQRSAGWQDFKSVFQHPPASTQQILHPDLYFAKLQPETVTLPRLKSSMPRGYVRLDENVIGEFALGEVLKQFLGPGDAEKYAPMWRGDRYALFENKNSKHDILVVLLALDNEKDTQSFFKAYRKLLEKKYDVEKPVAAGPEFANFSEASISCSKTRCLSIEGADATISARIEDKLRWAIPRTTDATLASAAHPAQ
jgi:hypothetical protein